MNKKIICMGIISLFLLTGSISTAVTIRNPQENNDRLNEKNWHEMKMEPSADELLQMIPLLPDDDGADPEISILGDPVELTCDGIDWAAYEYDVKNYDEQAIRLSEGLVDPGMAHYLFFIGKSAEVKEGMQIGIEFKDWSWFGDGPSLFIGNHETNEWECIGNNLGTNDNYEWKWRTTVDSNKYVYGPSGLIMIMVLAEGNDDVILRSVGVKYELEKEPIFQYDAYLGYLRIHPGSFFDIPPYSDIKLTVKTNPDFGGQNVLIPNEGARVDVYFYVHITEDAPTWPIHESWIFWVDDNTDWGPADWEVWMWWFEGSGDDAGISLFIKSGDIKPESDGVYHGLFDDGVQEYTFDIGCKYQHFLWDYENEQWNIISSWSEEKRVGRITFEIENNPPAKPIIEGPTVLKPYEEGKFTATATDPDNNNIQYGWDWNNDGKVDEWTKAKESGQPSSKIKSWDKRGTYTIRVKARDLCFAENKYESEWSDPFSINVRRSRAITSPQLLQILENLLNHFPLLEQLLNL